MLCIEGVYVLTEFSVMMSENVTDDSTLASAAAATEVSSVTMMTETTTIDCTDDAVAADVQPLDSSLLQSDAGDEGRLEIVVEDEDMQQVDHVQHGGQCAPAAAADQIVEQHMDTVADACYSASAEQLQCTLTSEDASATSSASQVTESIICGTS